MEFQELYTRIGIRREWTVPHNPQHNGVTERKKHFISKEIRVMLYDYDLPHYFQAYACSKIIYIQNRVSHRVLGKMTSKEEFTRKRLDVNHFRIFSNLAYCHIPRDMHYKLDQIVERGYFFGYRKTYKAYHIFIVGTRRIIVRCDVPRSTS